MSSALAESQALTRKRIIVTPQNFDACVEELLTHKHRSFDTETTGLYPFKGDRLFSFIFATETTSYYFNFQDYSDGSTVLPRSSIPKCQNLFEGPGYLFIHKAKFDWHIVEAEGIRILSPVWCTQTGARVVYNDHMKYSLAACAERIGHAKDDAVDEYIKAHKLWEWVKIPGKAKRFKDKFYDKVPYDVIVPYGFQDAEVGFDLGMSQIKAIEEKDAGRAQNRKPLMGIMEDEIKIIRVCQKIEKRGVRIDRDYCLQGAKHYEALRDKEAKEFENLTGIQHKDSGKVYAQAFFNLGYEVPKTPKGNPSFNDENLRRIDNPVCQVIKRWRTANQRAGNYFRNYLYFSDDGGVVHADMKNDGTGTGRFSYAEPNFQNIPKRGDEEKTGLFPVRKAILPHEGECLVSIDYKQQEFRLMLDYAQEIDLISMIKDGHDPHQATADETGLKRDNAKNLNFGLLYGMGKGLLALTLGCTVEEAVAMKYQYFRKLSEIKKFIRRSTKIAEQRGYVFDWAGGLHHFPDPNFAYKAANSIIQGGCARITKKAMIGIDEFLEREGLKASMIMQVHDELLFSIPRDELDIVPTLVKIMRDVYPFKLMEMECSVEHSWDSFGDLKEGLPV